MKGYTIELLRNLAVLLLWWALANGLLFVIVYQVSQLLHLLL